MDLDERKRHILKVLINDYIITAEPVGSRTIAKKYRLGLSPATIRNEMADLEDMGYLEQPHTSAGRVPSDKGYRIYVDCLMNDEKLSQGEINIIRDNIHRIADGEIERIIKDTSKLLSNLTNYTSLVMAPQANKSTVKSIQLVAIESKLVMAVVITNMGVIKNVMIRLSNPITGDKLTKINNVLNSRLKGLTVEEININVISGMQRDMTGYIEILDEIIPILSESLNYVDGGEVYLGGSSNIFNYPEYSEIDKARSFFSMLDKKDFLHKLMSVDYDNERITIGHENEYDEISDCSLITATYRVGNDIAGSIGVIGPTRMYYARVLAVLRQITECLNDMFSSYYFDD